MAKNVKKNAFSLTNTNLLCSTCKCVSGTCKVEKIKEKKGKNDILELRLPVHRCTRCTLSKTIRSCLVL